MIDAYPVLNLKDAKLPRLLAHGTVENALGGIFRDGIVPGRLLTRGGRDEAHLLRIDAPDNIGGKPPTQFQRIDFVGLQLTMSSGFRTAEFVPRFQTLSATT